MAPSGATADPRAERAEATGGQADILAPLPTSASSENAGRSPHRQGDRGRLKPSENPVLRPPRRPPGSGESNEAQPGPSSGPLPMLPDPPAAEERRAPTQDTRRAVERGDSQSGREGVGAAQAEARTGRSRDGGSRDAPREGRSSDRGEAPRQERSRGGSQLIAGNPVLMPKPRPVVVKPDAPIEPPVFKPFAMPVGFTPLPDDFQIDIHCYDVQQTIAPSDLTRVKNLMTEMLLNRGGLQSLDMRIAVEQCLTPDELREMMPVYTSAINGVLPAEELRAHLAKLLSSLEAADKRTADNRTTSS